MLAAVSFPTFSLPYLTAAAGTAFVGLIWGNAEKKIKVTNLRYTSGATAHDLTFMQPLASVLLNAAAAKGATSIVLASDPGAWGSAKTVAANNIANGDWIAYRQGDNTWEYNKLTGSPTTDADGKVTCAVSAIGAALPANTRIYYFGVPADSNPVSGKVHYKVIPPVSATTAYDANGGAVVSGLGVGDPMLVHSNNITAQGYLEHLSAVYGI